MIIRPVATRSCSLAGAIALALGSLAAAHAQEAAPQVPTFAVLHDFAGAPTDGGRPLTPLTPAGDGSFYGATFAGGTGQACPDGDEGCGTVYKLAADGSVTVLHDFTGGADGANPTGALITDEQGNVYGTATRGGDTTCIALPGLGCGVVFKLSPDGTETVLHTFSGPDGVFPVWLMRDPDGTLYGVASQGGDLACRFGEGVGCGVIFKLAPDGTYTSLHVFHLGYYGALANPDLVRDPVGNLYGTTALGGGAGTIYKLSPDGAHRVLHTFAGGLKGGLPAGGLVADGDGNLYGTTESGDSPNERCNSGCGTVFKLARDNTFTVLYAFKGGADGKDPHSTLYRDPRTGSLYGTTYTGGQDDQGTVFVLRPDGTEQVLLRFHGSDGAHPESRPVKGQGAQLVGVASEGGANNHGVIYSLQFGQQ